MGRVFFNKNSNGTYDIFDSETVQAIYNVSKFDLFELYGVLEEEFRPKKSRSVSDSTSKLDLENYAKRAFGFMEGDCL